MGQHEKAVDEFMTAFKELIVILVVQRRSDTVAISLCDTFPTSLIEAYR